MWNVWIYELVGSWGVQLKSGITIVVELKFGFPNSGFI